MARWCRGLAATIAVVACLSPGSAAANGDIGQGLRDEFYDFDVSGSTYAFNVTNGNFFIRADDLPLAGSSSDLALRRVYNSLAAQQVVDPSAGRGWRFSPSARLTEGGPAEPTRQYYTDWTGHRWGFTRHADGSFLADDPFFGSLRRGAFHHRLITEDDSQQVSEFGTESESNGEKLQYQRDELGNQVRYQWNPRMLDRLDYTWSEAGTTRFTTQPALGQPTRIIDASGPGGRRTYTYDADNYLRFYSDHSRGTTTEYSYDSGGRLSQIVAPGATIRIAYVFAENAYRV